MDEFLFLFYKTLPLYITVFIGLCVGRMFDMPLKAIANSFVNFILTPFLFFIILRTSIGVADLYIPFLAFGLCTLVAFTAYGLSGFTYKNSPVRSLIGLGAASGNHALYGIPVASLLIGPHIIPMLALFVIGSATVVNSIGVYLGSKNGANDESALKRLLRFPLLYAILMGLLCNPLWQAYDPPLFDLDLIQKPLNLIAGFGGMLIVGLAVGLEIRRSRRLVLDLKYLAHVFFFRFMFWPLLAMLIIALDVYLLGVFDRDFYVFIMMISFMPIPLQTGTFAVVLGLDASRAATAVLLTTLFSLFMMTVLVHLFL